MESKTRGFGGVGDGLNERLGLVGFEETLVDITATGGVVLKTDSRSKTSLKTIIEREEIVEGVR